MVALIFICLSQHSLDALALVGPLEKINYNLSSASKYFEYIQSNVIKLYEKNMNFGNLFLSVFS